MLISWSSGLPCDSSEAHAPPKVHGPRGHCSPLLPPLGGPDCSYVIAFSRQNRRTSKCHYKALDVTVDQRLIP